jgi:hypothetical protein
MIAGVGLYFLVGVTSCSESLVSVPPPSILGVLMITEECHAVVNRSKYENKTEIRAKNYYKSIPLRRGPKRAPNCVNQDDDEDYGCSSAKAEPDDHISW